MAPFLTDSAQEPETLNNDVEVANSPDIRISIDRGGTFCDVLVQIEGQEDVVFKLLSVDPKNYSDAATHAIRRTLEMVEKRTIPREEKLDASRIKSCRIGTTVATNALLEHKGERFAFLTTKGFGDLCRIGDQTRPNLFALNVRKAAALHDIVVEIDERITIEDYDLNPSPLARSTMLADPAVVETSSGEIIRVIAEPREEEVRTQLAALQADGYNNLAICFMHSYVFSAHEDFVADIARSMGFKHVTTSSGTNPVIKMLRRGTSVCSEAYLHPVIRRYIENLQEGFSVLPQRIDFMCSDGGLKSADKFRGNEALLSGPAGGVVGIANSCYDRDSGTPIVGFDMGGTSTDVCRFDGEYDLINDTKIAGRNISVPMLNIATVAAGGGSILSLKNGLFAVGPESAGAFPGPACYRNGGPLTVTDANLFLGRLFASSFPSVFGPNSDQQLDPDIVAEKFHQLTQEVNDQTGQAMSPEGVASGFLDVANEAMSRPIRKETESRGWVPEKHNLVSFGGAGGQHACAIATKLGIQRVLIHKYSSILSAYGISQAKLQGELYEPFAGKYKPEYLVSIDGKLAALKEKLKLELLAQGASEASIDLRESLTLRYEGTDTPITVPRPPDSDYTAAFTAIHLREFAFTLKRDVVVESVRVRGTGSATVTPKQISPFAELSRAKKTSVTATASGEQPSFVDGCWTDIPVYLLDVVPKGHFVIGPALIIDKTQTIYVEPNFMAYLLSSHVVIERVQQDEALVAAADPDIINPVRLSVFAHRFMAIAEQMGNTLQRTSISTSIKERLDFSCAIFSPDGELVANAPHIPVHIGSMQFAIQYQHKLWKGKLKPGDVLMSNHPESGGTHLPDITVVTPVFFDNTIVFYVASRGHHTDIGGKGITSMIPDSTELWEEGLSVRSMKIVSDGQFLEDEIRQAFHEAGQFPGCSPTRRIHDNISDLKAQMSANQRGIVGLTALCSEFTLPVVQQYMKGILSNAEGAVRSMLKQLAAEHGGKRLTASDWFDDGTELRLAIEIDAETGSAVFDFEGTGAQQWGNYNCPPSITHAAVIYCIRCQLDVDIPLNQGCLNPIDIRIPRGSILHPGPTAAICGSTLASQRVADVILRAFARCAASQGCANSLGWGMGGRDPVTNVITPGWNYGESLGGGSGAGPGWHGEHATHVHSTNSRNTDPEIVEKRTAVLVRQYAINPGTGGLGQFNGGNGLVREIEARIPLKFSIQSDRRVYQPYGMSGGLPGRVGRNYAFRYNEEGGMDKISLGGKAVIRLQPGERIQINTPGGGGWGVPVDSEAQLTSGPA